MVKINKVEIKIPAKLSIKSLTSFGSFVFSISDKIGTKAWLNAPSAKNLLNKLGILNTTTKMSWYRDAPKRFVVDISLSKPKTLEEKVQKLTFI